MGTMSTMGDCWVGFSAFEQPSLALSSSSEGGGSFSSDMSISLTMSWGASAVFFSVFFFVSGDRTFDNGVVM